MEETLMRTRSLAIAAIATAAVAISAAHAAISLGEAAGRYTISQAGSNIRFSIGKAGGGSLAGAFRPLFR